MKQADQKTPEWFEQRKMRITGSRVGAILGLSPWQKPHDVIRAMVREHHNYPSEFLGNPATDHGNNNEQRALLCFMRETGLQVEECGFFPYGQRLGASPDGLTSDGGVLEIKAPYSLRNGGEFKSISEQPHYLAQVQMELLSTGRTHAWFAQFIPQKGDPLAFDYVEEKMRIERVEFDPNWIDENLEKISRFYELLLSELDNEEHLNPLRVAVDTPEAGSLISELDEIRLRKKSDESREKEIVSILAEMTGGKNALIHGRNLTRVERKGSIRYAAVVKDHLPDLDLSGYTSSGSEYWKLS